MRVILKKRTPFVTFSFLKFGRKSTNLYDSKLSEFLSKGERAIFIQLGKNMYIKTGEELRFVLRKARLDAYTRFSPLYGREI